MPRWVDMGICKFENICIYKHKWLFSCYSMCRNTFSFSVRNVSMSMTFSERVFSVRSLFHFFSWHNLINIFYFSFWKGNKALPLSSFKFNDQRFVWVGELQVCVCEGGRQREKESGHDWVSEWQWFSVEWIMWSCEVWEHLICSAVVMVRSTAIHMSAEVPARRKIKSTSETLFFVGTVLLHTQNWFVLQSFITFYSQILWLINS